MSSNDNEHAQSGDMIEITTHLRNDLGKRMQVSTSDGLSVVALDNRMRVTVAHGDYKVVRRCGRPATDDAPKRKVGRPSNAELAARAAAVSDADWLARADAARAEGFATPEQTNALINTAKPVVTDADGAGLEAALYDVPVTRKTAFDVMVERKKEALNTTGSQANTPAKQAPADKAERGELETALASPKAALTVDESKVTVESGDVSVEAAVELMTQEQIDAAVWNLRPLHSITQEEFDAMTTHVEPRDDMIDALKYGISMTRIEPRGFLETLNSEYPHEHKPDARKHSHYFKTIPCNQIDVYRVLAAFNVADPCIQHAVKKLLVAGGRGSKDISRDVGEAIDALQRWQEMRSEEAAA